MHIRSGIMNYFFIRFQKKGGNTYFWKLPVRWFFREIVVARKNWRFWNWMQYFLCVCEWRRHWDLDQPCQIYHKYCFHSNYNSTKYWNSEYKATKHKKIVQNAQSHGNNICCRHVPSRKLPEASNHILLLPL